MSPKALRLIAGIMDELSLLLTEIAALPLADMSMIAALCLFDSLRRSACAYELFPGCLELTA